MRLENKVALITGAGQGIGLACAQAFAREGAKVVLADVNEAAARLGAAQLEAEGAQAAAVACDVASKAAVDKAIAVAVAKFGRLDILVANAGIVHVAEFLDLE